MTERALSFGAVAGAYERHRLGYPDAVVDTVLDYAGTPVRTALEVGAGTGKATRLFAARGIDVTATEPDEAMLAELRKHVPATVTTQQSSFEDLPLDQTYDLVYVAAALHWTQPEGRWPRVATLVRPGGTFASFGGQLDLADPDQRHAAETARAPFLEDDQVTSPDGTPPQHAMQWPGTELEASELFADVRQIEIERRATMSAEDYVGHLSTISAYLQLTDADRRQVFARTLAALPSRVELRGDVTVHLARRASSPRRAGGH